jgi:hypothetical protein
LAGASDGNWGGTRAVEALVPAIRETGLVVMSWDVFFPYVNKMFNDDGSIKEEHKERYERNVRKLYDELIWFARLLKQGREELETSKQATEQ